MMSDTSKANVKSRQRNAIASVPWNYTGMCLAKSNSSMAERLSLHTPTRGAFKCTTGRCRPETLVFSFSTSTRYGWHSPFKTRVSDFPFPLVGFSGLLITGFWVIRFLGDQYAAHTGGSHLSTSMADNLSRVRLLLRLAVL